jgi:hypothetical protein
LATLGTLVFLPFSGVSLLYAVIIAALAVVFEYSMQRRGAAKPPRSP